MSAYLDLLMFAAACLVLLMGFPVAFTLAGVALAFGLIGQGLDIFDMGFFYALPQRIFGTMTNEVLIAVPLFVFMGTMLERARVAEDLLENMSRLFAGVRGGLGTWHFRQNLPKPYGSSSPASSSICGRCFPGKPGGVSTQLQ